MMRTPSERRRFDRFVLPAMYSRVLVRPLDSEQFLWDGHAYDISRGGVRFELDQPIEPGTPVAMELELPPTSAERSTQRQPVYAYANVVWIEQDDLPGPVRQAAVFTGFATAEDEKRLLERIHSGRYALAA